MKSKAQIVMTLVCSFVIFAVGMFRLLTESFSSTPLFVAYIFAITGLIGVIANGVILKRSVN